MTKPNFQAMTKRDLRAYVLAHRDDQEAFHALADKLREEPGVEIDSSDQLQNLIEDRRYAADIRDACAALEKIAQLDSVPPVISSRYRVTLAPSVVERIAQLDIELQQKLMQKLEQLALNPYPRDMHLLKEEDNMCIVRLKQYRIIYQVKQESSSLTVLKFAHPEDY